jgi:hypothetical protein
MHIVGNVVKRAIQVGSTLFKQDVDAKEAQEEELLDLLKTARKTAFGKFYGFEAILKDDNPIKKYQATVPIFDYDKMYANWWHKQLENPDVTWPGKPNFFARSSGTTGNAKRIPVSKEMIESIRKVGISQLLSISNFDLEPEFFENQILMLGSSTKLKQVDDHEEGEISGISASNLPSWFEGVYRPGDRISSIDDWDERVAMIAKEAPEWNVSAMSGIPSWILLMIKEIIKVNKLNHIHEIWPNLSVYTSGGVAFEPYLSSFKEVFGKEVTIMDTYLASEGFIAYNARPETSSMKLAYEHGLFFEFIPFDERGFDDHGNIKENPLALTIGEVELEQDYALLVSTVSGTWRYMIGDLVRFTDLEACEIKISGRTKHFLNVVGSQLSENKMNDAIKAIEEKCGSPVDEYTIAAVKDESGDYYHEWVLGFEKDIPDAKKLAEVIDETLKGNTKNYEVARRKSLKGVKVFPVKKDRFYDWHERDRKKGGQIKTKKVMKEDDFKEFKEFVLRD